MGTFNLDFAGKRFALFVSDASLSFCPRLRKPTNLDSKSPWGLLTLILQGVENESLQDRANAWPAFNQCGFVRLIAVGALMHAKLTATKLLRGKAAPANFPPVSLFQRRSAILRALAAMLALTLDSVWPRMLGHRDFLQDLRQAQGIIHPSFLVFRNRKNIEIAQP